MKKLLALLLAVVLCLSLAACATTPKDTATDTTPADTAADTAKDDAADNTADDFNASEPAAEGGKNIVWAGWSGEEEASKDIFGRMMKAYPDRRRSGAKLCAAPRGQRIICVPQKTGEPLGGSPVFSLSKNAFCPAARPAFQAYQA